MIFIEIYHVENNSTKSDNIHIFTLPKNIQIKYNNNIGK